MDFRQRLTQHRELVAKLHEMEQRFETERRASLAALPARFGYTDLESFLGAVRAAALGQTAGRDALRPPGRRPRAPRPSAAPAPTSTIARPGPASVIAATPAAASVSPAAATSAPTAPPPPAPPPGMAVAAAATLTAATAQAPLGTPAPQIAPVIAPASPSATAPAPTTPAPAPVRPSAPSASPALSAGAPRESAPAPSRPTGTSLDDPANFGLMPDRGLLSRDGVDLQTFRSRLAEALRFAQRVLHTSRVPAAVWREWRQFERQAAEALRAATPGPSPDFD